MDPAPPTNCPGGLDLGAMILPKSPAAPACSPHILGKHGGKVAVQPCNRAIVQSCNHSTRLPHGYYPIVHQKSSFFAMAEQVNPLKRLRTRKACVPCSSRKGKCNGAYPCDACEAYGYTCHYREDGDRRRPANGISGSDRGGGVIEDPDANIRKSQKHARLDHDGCPAWSIICIAICP
jgi:Fungal Zn(2)-Cys(6) binuclear cluster domain